MTVLHDDFVYVVMCVWKGKRVGAVTLHSGFPFVPEQWVNSWGKHLNVLIDAVTAPSLNVLKWRREEWHH